MKNLHSIVCRARAAGSKNQRGHFIRALGTMSAWNRSAARPHDRRQIQACRAHIAPSRPVRRVLHALFSGASASCTARLAQTMSEPSSPSHAAQANCFCRRAQRVPSANHERTVKPLSCRAGESLCRRGQRILTPCTNHERTVKPFSCRAGELLLTPRPAHHPAAPPISALCAEMCIAMARASAGCSACRRRQSAPSMKRVCSARCRRWSS